MALQVSGRCSVKLVFMSKVGKFLPHAASVQKYPVLGSVDDGCCLPLTAKPHLC